MFINLVVGSRINIPETLKRANSMSTEKGGIPYTGSEELEVMTEARNYNAFLIGQILRYAPPRANVLDFGAGIGTFAEEVQSHGHRVMCVEPDPAQRQQIAAKGLPAVADVGDLKPGSFDFIYSLNVLEHIEDDLAALRALRDLLVPGGRLYLYVPAFMLLYSDFDKRIGHYRRYRRQPLVNLAESAGFTVERSGYCDSLGFLAWLGLRMAGRVGGVGRGPVTIYDRFIFPLSRLCDLAAQPFFGKNLALVARKSSLAAPANQPARKTG